MTSASLASEAAIPGAMMARVASPPESYDEMRAAPGVLRPHWQQFLAGLEAMRAPELARRWEETQRLVHENGITYNAYGDQQGSDRPWELDPLPLLAPAAEWRTIAAGLEQRARLLDRMLADLYGAQRLLALGLLPAELVFTHPGFLRPLHDQPAPGGRHLHLYAGDLARAPSGQWWVVGDRTEAPSGAGYSLENRMIVSRMFPKLFHDSHVERLAAYFMTLRETLRRLAPEHSDNPRIVLLSQGPGSRSYFEDAYLARYLGYTLVEGDDLAVRDGRVLLKTLGGLLAVDVVLRRVNDEDCDPLELRADSPFGVTGLAQAARAGRAAVVNTLGSGLAESPALMAFLPAICRELLGEDLQLPSVATWWCGDRTGLDHVLANLHRLIIKPVFRTPGAEPVCGSQLSGEAREALAAAIRARPGAYVGQEQVTRSCAPVWSAGQVKPWYVAVRAFLVAGEGGYETMGGGLARLSPTPHLLDLSISAGELSKDVWVLADGPVRPLTLLQPSGQSLQLRRGGSELPSRVADNLFWLGRHAERAESAARLLRTLVVRLTGEFATASVSEAPVLLRALASAGQIEPGFVIEGIREQLPAIEQILPQAVLDEQHVGSLRNTLSALRRAAWTVRDRISVDSWRIIHQLDELFRQRSRGDDLSGLLVLLNQGLVYLSAFSGLVVESMTRTQGWRFLDLGRRLERSLHTINLVQSGLIVDADASVLEAVLEVADSKMTYRSRYLAQMRLAPVLDLLLTDETNPRSLAFQLAALVDHVEHLPREDSGPRRTPEQRIAASLLHALRMIDAETMSDPSGGGAHTQLERLLSRLAGQLPKLAESISHKYLIHAGPLRQLAGDRRDKSV